MSEPDERPASAAPPESAEPPGAAEPPEPLPEAEDRRTVAATAGIAVLMLAFAVVALIDGRRLESGPGPGLLDAAAFPTLVAVLLIAVGGALLARSLLKLRGAPVPAESARPGLLRLAALVGALLVFALILPVAGFTLSSALLFTAAAVLLGGPHPLRLAAYGWALAGLLFLLFDVLIGLSLPSGPWGF